MMGVIVIPCVQPTVVHTARVSCRPGPSQATAPTSSLPNPVNSKS